MRTETITTTYRTFNELNDKQKMKAIEDNRDLNVDYEWWDHTYDDAKAVATLMGFNIDNIYFSGFSSQGDGACFVGSFNFAKGTVTKVKEYAPRDKTLTMIAEGIQELQRKSFYSAYGKITHIGRYSHENSISVDVESEKGAACDIEWKEVISDFCRWIYKQLEHEHDYLRSDEVIKESLIANETEFETENATHD